MLDVNTGFYAPIFTEVCYFILAYPYLCFCPPVKGAESKEEQSVGSHTTQQLSPFGCCALLYHYKPQPNGPRQEKDLPTMVRTPFIQVI